MLKRHEVHKFWQSDSPFSNWYPSVFTENNVTFQNTEQYMMYHKAKLFDDVYHMEKIMQTVDPRKIKDYGRAVQGFVNKTWLDNREIIVENGCYLKFTQIPELKKFILDTGDRMLIEASPYDDIWGIGLRASDPRSNDPAQWKGLNLLGKILMKVRDRINATL